MRSPQPGAASHCEDCRRKAVTLKDHPLEKKKQSAGSVKKAKRKRATAPIGTWAWNPAEAKAHRRRPAALDARPSAASPLGRTGRRLKSLVAAASVYVVGGSRVETCELRRFAWFQAVPRGLANAIEDTLTISPRQDKITIMNSLERNDIQAMVATFMTGEPDGLTTERSYVGRTPGRELSFDYCFNYFAHNLTPSNDMEKSCLVLGYYLASWGMLRGSSYLFQRTNARHYWPVIEFIEEHGPELRALTVDRFDQAEVTEQVVGAYQQIGAILLPEGGSKVVLVTKTMLGIFGNIPAYDSFLTATFADLFKDRKRHSFNEVDERTLGFIGEFYQANREDIDDLAGRLRTVDFETQQPTDITIPKAKIIDMYGFQTSFGASVGR